MARTTRAAWLQAGLVLLRDGGQDAVTVERLCEALERTKGSFYHHFEHVDAYLEALLDAWEEQNTSAPIAEADHAPDEPSRRRRALDEAVRKLDMRLELAVRAWSLRDPRAREAVARVDARRIRYLAEVGARHMPRARRELIGYLEYAAFLGCVQLDPALDRSETRRARRMLVELLTRLEGEAAPEIK